MTQLKRVLLALAVCLAVAANLDAVLIQTANPIPPTHAPTARLPLQITQDGLQQRAGKCWWMDHKGQHLLYVEGSPYEMGRCNSALTHKVLDRQQDALLSTFEQFFPSALARSLVVRGLLAVYGTIPAAFTDSDRLEILGLTHGRADPTPELGPSYARVSYYHAIHDISQAMVDNPLVACTALAVSGDKASGRTLLARNFDFEGGRVFDEHKVIQVVRPRVGLSYVSVAWAGMVGAVSGMNEARLAVVLNAAGSDDLDRHGRPTTLVLRSILQHATSISEAEHIVRSADLLVSDIFTLADGKTGELAVFEITPRAVAVRRASEVLGATNHFEHPSFAADKENAKRRQEGTTQTRYDRLKERLHAAKAVGPQDAVSVLRDRRLPGGGDSYVGHRGTIDAWIAAHSVVFDVGSLQFWVAKAPHTLGEYVNYDLAELLRGPPSARPSLAAAPELKDGSWQATLTARKLVAEAERSSPREAISRAKRALEASPKYMPALRALMLACHEAGDLDCAHTAAHHYLKGRPAYAKHRREAEKVAENQTR